MSDLDTTSCDREKIHLIASIQNQGAFLAFSPEDANVRHLSENFGKFFDLAGGTEDWIGRPIRKALPKELAEILIRTAESEVLRFEKRHSFEFGAERPWDIHVFRLNAGLIGVEFEPLQKTAEDQRGIENYGYGEILTSALRKMRESKTVAEIGGIACAAFRQLTGMERVMLYRFNPPEYYGVVVAEDRVAHTHSFMNHRFPASDIPKPARDLYLRNQVRLIHDSHSRDWEIHPKFTFDAMEPIDLSDSRLRAVSPIHVQYLKNMGVRGSFSVAVNVNGALWGLFACHDSRAISFSHAIRSACEVIANTIAISAPLLETSSSQQHAFKLSAKLHSLIRDAEKTADPVDQLFRRCSEIFELFQAGGMAYVKGSKIDFVGMTPARSEIAELALWVRDRARKDKRGIYETESLAATDVRWKALSDQTCGLLAIVVPEREDAVFMLFRPELVYTIQWGGDPRKSNATRNFQGTINPRLSFDTWNETVSLTSPSWAAYEREAMPWLKDLIVDAR